MEKIRVGDRIKEIRIAKKIKQTELSELAGVQPATLNRIEKNKAVGTVVTHLKLAKALGIELGLLYNNFEKQKKEGPGQIGDLDGEGRAFQLFVDDLSKKLTYMLYEISQKDQTELEKANKGAEGFIYNIEGSVEAYIGDERIKIEQGNTLYFDAAKEHCFKNIGEKISRILYVRVK